MTVTDRSVGSSTAFMECPKCGRVAMPGAMEDLYTAILTRCGTRDGQPVVDAIKFTLACESKDAAERQVSEWYKRTQATRTSTPVEAE